jgi:serine protease Do
MSLIQTDCAINSGNSGGALFNMYGEVIGITSAKYSNNGGTDAAIESIGFAIPINTVRGMIESIIEKGYAAKPYIGVYAETVTPNSGYSANSGIGIHDIIPGSPAERVDIRKGDVIIKIDGKYVTDIAELKSNIARAGIGGKLELTILRDGKELTIEVDVEENKTS